jgi:rhodanese-related sulfurtransferase
VKWSPRYARWPVALGLGAVTALFALPLAETLRAEPARKAWTDSYREVAPEDVAQMIRDGKKVVFVDVREPEEFAERHIPGARSIPVRATAAVDVAELADADLVVPYCLKDFRGFEGAKTLQRLGVPNVGLLKGYGIKSWHKAHLPEAGTQVGTLDEEGLRMIEAAVHTESDH